MVKKMLKTCKTVFKQVNNGDDDVFAILTSCQTVWNNEKIFKNGDSYDDFMLETDSIVIVTSLKFERTAQCGKM